MLNQFENSENKEILNRILNKENITEEYLNCLQEMLKENPSNTVYIFFEQYVEKNTDFNSLTVQGKYIDWLKTADVRTNNITDSWKSLLNLIDNTPITEDYLKGLKHTNERPLFNDLGLKDILEFSKKNPTMAKVIIEKCKQNIEVATPAILTPLIKLCESDPDLAFSIIDLKRNNGKNRFDRMDLFFIIEVAVNEPQIIRKALQLEKIMNEEMDNLPTYLLRAENQDLVKALASLIGKNDISELNKNEKKLLLISMLNNKGNYDLKYQKVSMLPYK